MALHYPSAEMVAVAWTKAVGGDVDPSKVATTLPADPAVWAATGFTTVTVLNASADAHVPLFEPVIAFDCWACAPGSNEAPWGQAGAIASAIHWGTYRAILPLVAIPTGFHPARVLTARHLDCPSRIPNDEAGFARVRLHVALTRTITAEVAARVSSGSSPPRGRRSTGSPKRCGGTSSRTSATTPSVSCPSTPVCFGRGSASTSPPTRWSPKPSTRATSSSAPATCGRSPTSPRPCIGSES